MPASVKTLIDERLQAANLTAGKLFRRVNKNGKSWGDGLTEKAVWHVVRERAHKAGIERTIFAERAPGCAIPLVENWSRYSFFPGTSPSKRPSGTLAASNGFEMPLTTASALNPRTDWSGNRVQVADHTAGNGTSKHRA
jgi:hypothetical protein